MVRRVSHVTSRPLRARNAEEKKKRRIEILRAAEHLWRTTPYPDLSMSQVAREAQLAKGTLYLYFDTKEELFLALLTEHLEHCLKDLLHGLEAARCTSADQLTDLLVARVVPQEGLRRLLVLLTTVINPSLADEQSQNFRRMLLRYVLPILDVMPFERRTNLRVLMHMYALALGWQLASSGSGLETRAVFSFPSPDISPRPRFEDEFPRALRASVRALVEEAYASVAITAD